MRLRTFLAAGAVASVALAGAAQAEDMTIVSWGGAYSASQMNAYHEPYMEMNPGVNIINDESAAEAVAKLRAMAEAGNTTWDVVDVVASDAIRLCDEGLAMEVDVDSMLAAAPDGTPASEDFGDFLVTPCCIPQIVYSTTFGYRTDMVGDTPPKAVFAAFDPSPRECIHKLVLSFGRSRILQLPIVDRLPCRPAPEPPALPCPEPDWYAGVAESESHDIASVQISVEATAGQNLCRAFPPDYLLPFWEPNPNVCFAVLLAEGCFCDYETGFIYCPCPVS